MAGTFDLGTAGTQDINTILASEANRIGSDVHKNTLHTSPWIDLIKKETFPDQMGYNLTTLVYNNALPTTGAGNDVLSQGSNLWIDAGDNASGNSFGTNTNTAGPSTGQNLADASASTKGPQDNKGHINFAKELKRYNLVRAVIESPKIDVQDLRFAAHRTEQLRAVMDVLTESSRYVWEERYRDEFDKLCDNYVACRTGTGDASKLVTGREGLTSLALMDDSEAVDTTDGTYTAGGQTDTDLPEANISNALMDDIYFKLVRAGAGTKAYGRENGRPVFGLVCSSEVSRQLQIEDSIRDDVRYNNARVSDLIAPLGVEKSFRGYYHLIDDLAPRFELTSVADGTGSSDTLKRVYPYTISSGVVTPNPKYDSAPVELAYVIHEDVFASQIPAPLTGGNGLSFNPVNYKGDFKWLNIPDAVTNPDGTIGFFRGVMASASKPIKPKFGYAIAIQRNSTTACNGL
tara:strand:- start:65 stop:1447 length:1383 start_codon:yes stop_codon:yes gene_type:complete